MESRNPSRRLFTGLACVLGVAASAPAHHSFAPHFDRSKPVVISGVVSEYEQRNPHAYLHVMAEDAGGQTHEYVCESHGVTQLTRNGITADLLTRGTVVTLTGSQARRDPYMCFFRTVEFSDGRVFDVDAGLLGDGPTVATTTDPENRDENERADIYGAWLRVISSGFNPSGGEPMMDSLTAAGRAAVEQYDPFVDDPTFSCDPVAIRRVWSAPGTPVTITRDRNRIVIRHEWMDAQRIVHLDRDVHPASAPGNSLGHSIGRFEGDTLVIETAYYAEGVLRQYVEMPGQPTRGMLHSRDLTTVERIRFDEESERLHVEIEHHDPTFYASDFRLVTYQFAPSDLELQPFGCRPENPDQTLR